MGSLHFIFALLNFRTLGALKHLLNERYPGAVEETYRALRFEYRIDLIFGSFALSTRSSLLMAAVLKPNALPTYVLGDEDVSDYIYALRNARSTAIYRFLAEMTGVTRL